jgi:hypothetical protein
VPRVRSSVFDDPNQVDMGFGNGLGEFQKSGCACNTSPKPPTATETTFIMRFCLVSPLKIVNRCDLN